MNNRPLLCLNCFVKKVERRYIIWATNGAGEEYNTTHCHVLHLPVKPFRSHQIFFGYIRQFNKLKSGVRWLFSAIKRYLHSRLREAIIKTGVQTMNSLRSFDGFANM